MYVPIFVLQKCVDLLAGLQAKEEAEVAKQEQEWQAKQGG